MNSIEALEKEIDYLEIRKQTAYRNEYYSVYQECEERINNLKKIKQDLERLEKLEENYYSLNVACEEIEFENVRLEKENKKLKQVIEILKDKFYLRVHSNMFGSWLFIKEKIKNGKDVYCELDLDIVDTIKEVFENE